MVLDYRWFIPDESIDESLGDMLLEALDRLMVSSLNEFIKASGRAEAFSALKPYVKASMYNHVRAARKLMNLNGSGPDTIMIIYQMAQACIIPPGNINGEIMERAVIETIRECPFSKGTPDFCIFTSHFSSEAICEIVNPEYECVVTHHLTDGDPYCRHVFKKKSDSVTILDDPGRTLTTLPTLEIPKGYAYGGHLAMDSGELHHISSAFMDLHGEEEATRVLGMNAKEVGRELGSKLLEISPELGRNEAAIGNLVDSLGKLILQHGECTKGQGDAIEKEITSCPFQIHSKLVCLQYEALIQGMLETVNSNYEFVYDRMMSQGDTTCHWVVRKKGERMIDVQDTGSKETALELLKKRLVMGEIQEEEYKRLKALIEE